MRVNQLKDTCFTNPKQRNYTLDKCLISNEKTIGVVSNYIKKFDEVRKRMWVFSSLVKLVAVKAIWPQR